MGCVDFSLKSNHRSGTEVFSEIPELPSGRRLVIELFTNWGDLSYIGLNAVEIFTVNGSHADVVEVSTNAESTIGRLESLLEDISLSKGKHDTWCANVEVHRRNSNSAGTDPITITFALKEVYSIAMVRFWNYNESRVKGQIGVRHLGMQLDDVPIFRGEIDCAFSATSEFEPEMGDTILFTTEDSILEAIAEHDVCLVSDIVKSTSILDISEDGLTPFRPMTREKCVSEVQTRVVECQEPRPKSARGPEDDQQNRHVQVIHFELLSNWGMPDLIGLTGIEILDDSNKPIDMALATVSVHGGNPKNIHRLFNGNNLTRNPDDMWTSDFDGKKPIIISMRFAKPILIRAISFWNFNACPEVSYAGIRLLQIFVNGKLSVGNLILRKATGYVFFDYVQDVAVEHLPCVHTIPPRPSSNAIRGFIFQFRLLSTWGDEFYIGLNGIDVFNRRGDNVRLKPQNLAAFPESVNILPSIEGDPRRSENLIDGVNDTTIPSHMWLTPLLPNNCARIFFVFDTPTIIARFRLYNYRKTPERGARHITVSVDDIIVFSGELPQSTADYTGQLDVSLQEL